MKKGARREARGDRKRQQATGRNGVSMRSYRLDFYLTCNHIHLLIKDTGNNIIAESMQLVPARVSGADKRSRSLFR